MKPAIILKRIRQEINATLGTLELGGPVFKHFATLEPLEVKIPPGKYPLIFEYSPKFKRHLWELKNVPGHTEIKIHNGNTRYARDKDGYTYEQTEGCPLIGMRHGELFVSAKGRNGLPTVSGDQPAVLGSRAALEQFHRTLAPWDKEALTIEVI